MNMCSQRRVREVEAARKDARAQDTCINYTVERIPTTEAKRFIVTYEHLGTMAALTADCYGARDANGELAAVAVFGYPPGQPTRYHGLQRGACAYWAHWNTAS